MGDAEQVEALQQPLPHAARHAVLGRQEAIG